MPRPGPPAGWTTRAQSDSGSPDSRGKQTLTRPSFCGSCTLVTSAISTPKIVAEPVEATFAAPCSCPNRLSLTGAPSSCDREEVADPGDRPDAVQLCFRC